MSLPFLYRVKLYVLLYTFVSRNRSHELGHKLRRKHEFYVSTGNSGDNQILPGAPLGSCNPIFSFAKRFNNATSMNADIGGWVSAKKGRKVVVFNSTYSCVEPFSLINSFLSQF